jgi:putative ABC transport system substrate-binding protein
MDRRRFLLTSLAGALAAPLAGGAQAGKVYRVAIVYAAAPIEEISEAKDPFLRSLFTELRRLGYTEGQDLAIERRSGGGRREGYPDVAREVVRSGPDLIFAQSGRLAQAFRGATTTIPIVTITSGPVELGLATSLARPGGNVTGFSLDVGLNILGKRLELLKEAVPRASRVAYLTPRAAWEIRWGQIMRDAGAHANVTVLGALLDNPIGEAEYRRAFAAMVTDRPDALVVSDHAEGIRIDGS